jgi:(S)-ureidoglycine aminohydrolase
MHQLGLTRSSYQRDHALLTPDTFVRAPLPGMKNAVAIVHAAPAMGAAFTQYTAEFAPGGMLGPASSQRFVYVLDGEIVVETSRKKQRLRQNGYAYLPPGKRHQVAAVHCSRAAVIEKRYQPTAGVRPPPVLIGDERSVAGEPLQGDQALEVRTLLPADPAFDLAINSMTFQPGASLPMVEIHVMQHGLLMLEGGGIYRLGECWYPVIAGDFIWMAPYCPQWFAAVGKIPARYLIYKDWNRHPLGDI